MWIFTVSDVQGGENSDINTATGTRGPLVVAGNFTVLLRSGGGPEALSRLQSNAEKGLAEVAKKFKPKSQVISALSTVSDGHAQVGAMSQGSSSNSITEVDNGI